MAFTKVIAGANDATATIEIKRTVHIVTHKSSGHRDMTWWKIEWKNVRDMIGGCWEMKVDCEI